MTLNYVAHKVCSMRKPSKKPMGRPPKPESERLGFVGIRFSNEMLEMIDSMRAERIDKPDRSAFIRELVGEAIQARQKRPGK